MSYSIIITASYIKSHPSIQYIKKVINSLYLIEDFNNQILVILAHDYSDHEDYKNYFINLQKYLDKYSLNNFKIIMREDHGHLTGNIRNAIQYINTEYVLIIQHDLIFIRSFRVSKIIEDTITNTELKHIRFNKRITEKIKSDSLNDLFGKQIISKNYTYTRTPSWSDNNHLCKTEYYKNIVLEECNDGKPMEYYLINKSKNEEIHNKYGSYIFDCLNSLPYIFHLDGSKRKIFKNYSIIITASYIRSHPSIQYIKKVIESLNLIKDFNNKISVILAHDYSDHEDYKNYLINLQKYLDKYSLNNFKIIMREDHGHLTGNIRNAIQYINTEYVLIIQHDLIFTKSFRVSKIIDDTTINTELKHIRFNKRKNKKKGTDALNDLFGKQIISKNYTYTRTPAWSDQNHLCKTEYYKNIILKECKDGHFMEHYLIQKSKNEEIHNKYGTYIFDCLNAQPYIFHLNGAERKFKKVNNFQEFNYDVYIKEYIEKIFNKVICKIINE